MTTRVFNIAVILSTILFCLIVVAWIAGHWIDPRSEFVSISNSCHVSISTVRWDARLHFFNDSSYGPYSGSIIGIAGDPNGPKVTGFGDTAGIYVRWIRWRDGYLLWTFSLSLVYLLTASTILPLVWIIRRSRREREGFPIDVHPKKVDSINPPSPTPTAPQQ